MANDTKVPSNYPAGDRLQEEEQGQAGQESQSFVLVTHGKIGLN